MPTLSDLFDSYESETLRACAALDASPAGALLRERGRRKRVAEAAQHVREIEAGVRRPDGSLIEDLEDDDADADDE
jgi:hypothetical protein